MKEQIENLTARKLDALVAEKVMGWTRHPEKMHPTDNRTINDVLYCPPGFPYDRNSANVVPYFSTDIAAAWSVVEKVKSQSSDYRRRFGQALASQIQIRDCDYRTTSTVELALLGNGDAPGLSPRAICIAALIAVE